MIPKEALTMMRTFYRAP